MTKKMNISFSPPDISEAEIAEVVEVLKSGWITTGPRTKLFEKKIAEYVGTEKSCCLSSQTACAEMALRVLGVGAGDEVITSPYTYTASAAVVCHTGATLKFVDIQSDCLEMDYDKLEDAITEKTKAIIPVDLAGIPCDYDRIFEIVERKKHLFKPANKIQEAIGRVAIMADTAHSFGAQRGGKKAGAIADFSSFSFHAVKNLTTAEGGATTWRKIDGIDSEDIYRQMQLFSLHGQTKDALAKTKLGAWDYDIAGTWYKCNMTDIAAAVGLKQLERYPALLARRRRIVEKYDAALAGTAASGLKHFTDKYSSSAHLYITRTENIDETKRNEIVAKMAECGVACNVHYKPLPMHTAYKKLGFDIKGYPNAYAHFANAISLPLHTLLTDEQVDYIAQNFVRIIGEYA